MLPGRVLKKQTPFSRLPQDEENHEQTTDVRSQLRFFEQLERMEKQRKDEQEREILLKAAKVPKHKFCVLCSVFCVRQRQPGARVVKGTRRRRIRAELSACFHVDRFTALRFIKKTIIIIIKLIDQLTCVCASPSESRQTRRPGTGSAQAES